MRWPDGLDIGPRVLGDLGNEGDIITIKVDLILGLLQFHLP